MARTRVNYKFLALAGAPILALVVLFVLWKFVPQFKWLYRGTPAQHAAQGKELYEQGKYYEAGEKYKRAIQLRGTPDAAMYTCLGDCYMHMVQKDAENLRIAKTCYDQALGVDPTYLPAQKALLDLFLTNTEMIRGTAAAQQWDDVQEVAKKVLALDPHDKEAVRTVPRATIMRWVAGLETDQQKIDDAIDSLAKIAQGPPFDTDAMWFLLQARMYRADERKRVNDREGMLAAVASALKELEDALQAHPDDALLHYRAAMVFRLASITEGRPSPNQPPKYQDRYSAELQKAAVLVQPDNEKYVELKLAWGKQLESQQDADGAEKLYRALLKERPADMPVRLALADVLSRSPASRDEAIDLLEHAPPSDPKTVYGLYALVAHNQEQLALSKVIGMKLDAAPAAQNSQAYDAQLKEIDDDFAKLLAGAGEGPATLQLRGRIEMARGKYIDAVQTLERALKLVTTGTGGGGVDIDLQYQIMYLLARANIAVKQTARAKELLTRIVTDIPKFVPARLLLVQMLLGEHEFDAAKDHLDELAKAMPDSPVVTRLRMLTLDKDKDKATLDALYNSLPERNPDEQIDKAQAAIYLGRKEETARLLEAVHGKRPDLLEVTATLARLYFDLGDKSRAVSMVDEALAKAPDNQSLKMLKAEIAGADVGELRKELIDKETDPFRKALMSFQLALQEDRQDDAQSQLELAAKLKPDNGEVLSYLFQFALGKKDFTQASALMEKLAQGNQDGAGGLLFRVRYAMAQGQYESAADMATQLTQKMPEFAQAWVVLGEVQMAQRKYNDAMSNFSQALTRQAQNLDALRGLIRCGYALDQPSTAKRYIDQARKLFPRNIVLRDIDLDHELHYGDPEKVIQPRQEILQKAIDSKDPAEARAWLALGQTYMAVARDKMIKGGAGAPAAAKPFIEKARDTFKGAVQKWPDELGFTQLYADALLQLRTPAEGEKALIALRDRPAWQNKPEPTLLLAEYYGRTGKAADQEKLLRDYLAGAPSTISVETQLAGMLTKQGKLDDALKVLAPNAGDPAIRKLRIELQITAGHFADAEKEIADAVSKTANPGPDLLNRQAYIYMYSGRATQALEILNKVLASDPQNTEALLYRSSIYVGANRNLDDAIRDLQYVRDAIDNADARKVLADAYLLKGDTDAAARELEAAVKAKPNDKDMRLALFNVYASPAQPHWSDAERVLADARANPLLANDADLIHAESLMWLTRKDTDKALQLIDQARKLAPANMNVFRTQCQILFEAKKYDALLKLTDPIVKQKQAAPWVYKYRGRAKRALDDKQAAIEEWSAGLDVATASKDDQSVAEIIDTIASEVGAPAAISRIIGRAEKGETRWRIFVALLYQTNGDIPSAINWIEKVLADEGNLPPQTLEAAQNMAGSFYLQLDPPDAAKAVAVYKKVLEKKPNDPIALNNLACTMILSNSGYTPKDAIEYSKRAEDLMNSDTSDRFQAGKPYIDDTHGYLLVLNGRIDEGMALIQQAIDRKAIPDAYYHLGEAYLAQNPPRPDQAEPVLKQAMSLVEHPAGGNKSIDSTLKSNIQKALDRCKEPVPSAAK